MKRIKLSLAYLFGGIKSYHRLLKKYYPNSVIVDDFGNVLNNLKKNNKVG